MRLVRFLKKSYHNDTIYEAGDTGLIGDDVPLATHMVCVVSEAAGLPVPPHVEQQHIPAFHDHSADVWAPHGVIQRDGTSPHDPAVVPPVDAPVDVSAYPPIKPPLGS